MKKQYTNMILLGLGMLGALGYVALQSNSDEKNLGASLNSLPEGGEISTGTSPEGDDSLPLWDGWEAEKNQEEPEGLTALDPEFWEDGDQGGEVEDPAKTTVTETGNGLVINVVNKLPECSDGIDNDGNGLWDFPYDPGCGSPDDNHEYTPQCRDGIDNDGNGLWDFPYDPGCGSPDDDNESGGDNITTIRLKNTLDKQ